MSASGIEIFMRCCLFLFALYTVVASGQSIPENLLPPSESTGATTTALPAAPAGRSTVMGGELKKVDLVRDQLALKVPGGRTIRILFDERTQVYENGKRISLLNLRPEDHASIETTLDGTAVFALRIHMLTELPDGHLHGQVLSYSPGTGELRLRASESSNPVTLFLASGVPVTRVRAGTSSSSNLNSAELVRGTLVDATFKAGKNGPGTATRLDILAAPGDEFVFRGTLSVLDLRAGRISVVSTAENQPTDVAFEPSRFEVSHDLRQGAAIKVVARFDGVRYVASSISIE